MKYATLAVVLAGCWIAPAEPAQPDRVWRKVTTTGETPPALLGPRGTYDSKRGQLVFYGGRTGSTPTDDNLAYADEVWIDPCPGCTRPGPRIGAAFGYDSRRDRFVLAGGGDTYTEPPGMSANDQVWEYDPNENKWTSMGRLPEPRLGGFLIDDTARGALVLLGGSNAAGLVSKVYEYDGTTWRLRDVGPTRPMGTGGFGTSVTYDAQLGRILALVDIRDFDSGAANYDELWELTDRWRRLCTDCSMRSRRSASIVWAGGDGWTYLINGYDNDEIAGTWRFDETTLKFVPVDPLNPGMRDSSAVVYDAKRDAVVLYAGNGDACGGDCSEVLEYVRR